MEKVLVVLIHHRCHEPEFDGATFKDRQRGLSRVGRIGKIELQNLLLGWPGLRKSSWLNACRLRKPKGEAAIGQKEDHFLGRRLKRTVSKSLILFNDFASNLGKVPSPKGIGSFCS